MFYNFARTINKIKYKIMRSIYKTPSFVHNFTNIYQNSQRVFMNKLVICLSTSLLFTGCATTKMSPAERNLLNQKQALLKTTPVAMIVDSCLLRNEVGTDLIVTQQSSMTAEKFAGLLSQQLNDQGIKIGKQLKPFVCGYMPQQQLQKYDYKADNDAKRTKVTQYPLLNTIDSTTTFTAQQQTALLKLNQSFNTWQLSNAQNIKDKNSTTNTLELSDEDVAVLRDITQSNYIFTAAVNGVDASLGQWFAAGALSVTISVATAGAGANVVTVLMPKEGQHYTVHIVDLDKKTVIWTKGGLLTGDLYSITKHSVEAKAILDPLFEVSIK